ncbi:MAG TPA: hypothetical protein VEI46_00305 [Thermodesulfovibrionales bacterium]|nr:hypothetical protein [Thermodesulfovibrionales bacterium]
MRRLSCLFITAILALSFAALFHGCGGGGASTSRGGGTDATLTASNASQVGDAVAQAVKLVTPSTALGEVKGASVSPDTSAPLISIIEKVVPVVEKHAANQKQSSALLPSQNCENGGNIQVTNISVPDLSGHVTADVNVNACTIGSEVMSGTLEVTVPVGAINDLAHVTDFTIVASSFTYSDPHSTIALTDNFTMIASNITYSGNSLTGGSLTLGGTVSGIIDGEAINIGCDSFGLSFSVDTAGGITVSISGRINASCLGGWVSMATNQQVYLPAHASCPTGGEIVVSAGGISVNVSIQPSSEIDIFFNGSLIQKYDNCLEVIGLCIA